MLSKFTCFLVAILDFCPIDAYMFIFACFNFSLQINLVQRFMKHEHLYSVYSILLDKDTFLDSFLEHYHDVTSPSSLSEKNDRWRDVFKKIMSTEVEDVERLQNGGRQPRYSF